LRDILSSDRLVFRLAEYINVACNCFAWGGRRRGDAMFDASVCCVWRLAFHFAMQTLRHQRESARASSFPCVPHLAFAFAKVSEVTLCSNKPNVFKEPPLAMKGRD
jgi:hypothetical protein